MPLKLLSIFEVGMNISAGDYVRSTHKKAFNYLKALQNFYLIKVFLKTLPYKPKAYLLLTEIISIALKIFCCVDWIASALPEILASCA